MKWHLLQPSRPQAAAAAAAATLCEDFASILQSDHISTSAWRRPHPCNHTNFVAVTLAWLAQESKRNVLKDFVHIAGPLGVTQFLILTATENACYLRIAKAPRVSHRLCTVYPY